MTAERVLRRLLLGVALLAAFGVVVVIVLTQQLTRPEAWSGLAAALAVITAVISAWTSQRSLEHQEDRLRPYPYPVLDLTSRANLMLLRLENFGASAAHNVVLDWDEQPRDQDENPVGFEGRNSIIPVLHPGERLAATIGSSHVILNKYDDLTFTGTVCFEDPDGRAYSQRFICSADQYRSTILYSSDSMELINKAKKIPEQIEKLQEEMKRLRETLPNS